MSERKMKMLTFSYDDGITQDIRFIELLNKYGMKGTFNLNSGTLGKTGELIREENVVAFNKVNPEDVKHIYMGHEVAVHTVNHPWLGKLSDDEVIREVEDDRIKLSELCGYEVVGMAYPLGSTTYTDKTVEIVRNHTGVKYARSTTSTYNFDPQTDLINFHPTIHHHNEYDKLFELGEQFINLKTDTPKVFYVWGHTFEFDIHNDWARFEEFLQMMAGKEDICYCTNKEALL